MECESSPSNVLDQKKCIQTVKQKFKLFRFDDSFQHTGDDIIKYAKKTHDTLRKAKFKAGKVACILGR